jgi:hypothetical protein
MAFGAARFDRLHTCPDEFPSGIVPDAALLVVQV